MMLFTSILVIASLWIPNMMNVQGISCVDYSESQCRAASLCYYSDSAQECRCNSSSLLEVAFLMDSSGSVEQSGWDNEKDFVIGMVESGLPESAKIGLIRFSSTGSVEKLHYFTSDQDRDYIVNLVDGLSWTKGQTAIRTALENAIDIFEWTTFNYSRLIMLITDGNPYPYNEQNPCKNRYKWWSNTDRNYYYAAQAVQADLAQWDITTIIIGVGNEWNPSILSCLVEDEDTQIIEAANFNSDSLAAVRAQTDDWLCQSSLELQLSEVRVESGDDGGNVQFIEYQNTGDPWEFSSNSLVLSGYVSGTIDTGSIDVGQYIVFYNSDRSDSPNCESCDCNDGSLVVSNGDGRCDNAIYVACCASGCPCDFNSYSNDDWTQTATDSTDQFSETITFDDSFSEVLTGWTYEYIGGLDTDGQSWAQSCTSHGTPGDDPLETCDVSCVAANCQSNGDSGASCNGNDQCDCTTENHYFRDPNSGLCVELPPPEDCVVEIVKDGEAEYTNLMEWDYASINHDLYDIRYALEYYEDGSPVEATVGEIRAYTYYDSFSQTAVPTEIRTYIEVDGETTYSEIEECDWITQTPTGSPTPKPTPTVPVVDCFAEAHQGSKQDYTVTWNSDLSVDSFYVFEYYQDSKEESNIVSYDASGDYSINVAITGSVSSVYDDVKITVGPYTDDSESATEAGATECVITTLTPSDQPTNQPSAGPTPSPTTGSPTGSPTHSPYEVYSCAVEADGSEIEVSYNLGYSTSYGLGWDALEVILEINDGASEEVLNEPGPDTVTGISDAANQDYKVYASYYSEDGAASKTDTAKVTCTFGSLSPTARPTGNPTTLSPTPAPTTGAPFSSPTRAPVFPRLQIADCRIDVGDGQFAVTFWEPDTAGTEGAPDESDIEYCFKWGNEFDCAGGAGSIQFYPNDADINDPDDWYQIFESFDPATQTMKVSMHYEPTGEKIGDRITCVVYTRSPTLAPTENDETEEDPQLYFADLPSGCNGGELDAITGEFGRYECLVEEAELAQTFTVARSPSGFGPDVTFTWSIVYEDPFADEDDQGEDDDEQRRRRRRRIRRRRRLQDYADSNDFDPSAGESTVYGYDGNQDLSSDSTGIDVEIVIEEEDDEDDSDTEVAWLVIESCESGPSASGYQYTCTASEDEDGQSPSVLKLIIEDNSGGALNTSQGEIDDWVWYVIAAGVVAVAALAYFGWHFYNKRKFAEAMLDQRKAELENVGDMDALDNFGELGEDVRFNPLATAGTHDIATGGDYIDAQLAAQKDNFEVAQVDVDHQVYRQDFGPVQQTR